MIFSITIKMILNYYIFVNNCPPAPRSEDGSAGGGVGGIPPRPSVPPERSGGGQFRSKKVRAKFLSASGRSRTSV